MNERGRCHDDARFLAATGHRTPRCHTPRTVHAMHEYHQVNWVHMRGCLLLTQPCELLFVLQRVRDDGQRQQRQAREEQEKPHTPTRRPRACAFFYMFGVTFHGATA